MKITFKMCFAVLALVSLALTGCYKVTGGGKFVITSGALMEDGSGNTLASLTGQTCAFTFTAQSDETGGGLMVPAKGQIQIVNRAAGIIFHGVVDQSISQDVASGDDAVVYFGSTGSLKFGKGKPEPVVGFQLVVFNPTSGTPSLFLGGGTATHTLILEANLDAGNVQIHAE